MGTQFRCPELKRKFSNLLKKEVLVHNLVVNIFVWMSCHSLPRHGASLPIGIGVSCSADRQAHGKITEMEFFGAIGNNPSRFYQNLKRMKREVVEIDLNMGMDAVLRNFQNIQSKQGFH